MRVYLFSLGAGLLVRSPAPPLVALVGLLGILLGEQIIPVGKQMLAGSALAAAWHDNPRSHRLRNPDQFRRCER
jgi:XapX domain-containing protein